LFVAYLLAVVCVFWEGVAKCERLLC